MEAALCSSPILAYTRRHNKLILDTDASKVGIGAVFSQLQGGEEEVIEYYKWSFNKIWKDLLRR